jgi:hypothetical protein
MNRYKVTKQLGDGTYGSVLKAVNRSTGETVRVSAGVGLVAKTHAGCFRGDFPRTVPFAGCH